MIRVRLGHHFDILPKLVHPSELYHAFRHFNVSMMDALRVPLKTIQERIGHALTGSLTLDVYGHTLDWKANEDAAEGLGSELAKAAAEAEKADIKLDIQSRHSRDSDHLTAHQKKNLQIGVRKSLKTHRFFGCGGWI